MCRVRLSLRYTWGKGKPSQNQTVTAGIVPRFDNPLSVLPVASRPVVYSHSRDSTTIRGSRVCFREARRSAVSSTVSTRVRAHAIATTMEREIYRRERKGEKEIVLASCTFVSRVISAFLLYSSLKERTRDEERSLFYSSAKT